jgi:hypothetical protein
MDKYRRILRQVLNEELSKKEVEDIVSNELDRKFKTRDFERLINSITADAMSEFFDRLWMKKQFIKDCIKN